MWLTERVLQETLRQYDKDVRGYSFEISRAREALKEEEPLGIQGYYDEKEVKAFNCLQKLFISLTWLYV